MAGVSQFSHARVIGVNNIFDDDCDSTATDNVDAGPTTMHSVCMINASSEADYVKIYDDADPVVGTDGPDFQFAVTNSETRVWHFAKGIKLDTALSFACVQEGGTAGTTDPATPIDVYVGTNGGD